MHGLALILLTTTVGVDHGWQSRSDGNTEYIIQLEPQALALLKSGRVITSEIDPRLGTIRSVQIRLGSDKLPREQLASLRETSQRDVVRVDFEEASESPTGFSEIGPGNADGSSEEASTLDTTLAGEAPLELPPINQDELDAVSSSVYASDGVSLPSDLISPPSPPTESPREGTVDLGPETFRTRNDDDSTGSYYHPGRGLVNDANSHQPTVPPSANGILPIDDGTGNFENKSSVVENDSTFGPMPPEGGQGLASEFGDEFSRVTRTSNEVELPATAPRPSSNVDFNARNNADNQSPPAKPSSWLFWLPLLALMGSGSLNVYLGWITWDTHNRFHELVDDVRTAEEDRARKRPTDATDRENAADKQLTRKMVEA